MEIAGEIVALGARVSGLSVGDKIASLLPGGGYAAYAIAAAPLCMPIPTGLSMVEAAAIPETYLTVWTNLFERGGCKSGDIVLIHGGTSGIGTTAIQLAKAWGARVYATAGSEKKARACEALGAVRGIDYKTEDFVEVMRAETKGRGVDITLDMVAGSYVQRNLDIAAVEGRVVTISLLGGSRAEINMGTVLTKRLTLTGSTLRSSTEAQKAQVADAVRAKRVAADRRGQGEAGDFQNLPAGRSQRGASADGDLQSHRQNRAHDFLTAPMLRVVLVPGELPCCAFVVRYREWCPGKARLQRKIAAPAAFCRRRNAA